MSATGLAAFQAGFAAALRARDPAAWPPGLSEEARARFRIYRNNVRHGLGRELATAYPVVRRLVGDAFFAATAQAFLDAHPPRTRSLALFGGDFPVFLAGFPPAASVPYLADVARLERARLECLHAADAPPLALDALARLGDDLALARLRAHPAARLVASPHPIVDIWTANQAETVGPARLADAPQTALLTRPGHEVRMLCLGAGGTAFVAGLLAGERIVGAADEAARAPEPSLDLAALLAALLQAGAFTALLPAAAPV